MSFAFIFILTNNNFIAYNISSELLCSIIVVTFSYKFKMLKVTFIMEQS